MGRCRGPRSAACTCDRDRCSLCASYGGESGMRTLKGDVQRLLYWIISFADSVGTTFLAFCELKKIHVPFSTFHVSKCIGVLAEFCYLCRKVVFRAIWSTQISLGLRKTLMVHTHFGSGEVLLSKRKKYVCAEVRLFR